MSEPWFEIRLAGKLAEKFVKGRELRSMAAILDAYRDEGHRMIEIVSSSGGLIEGRIEDVKAFLGDFYEASKQYVPWRD